MSLNKLKLKIKKKTPTQALNRVIVHKNDLHHVV